MSSFLRALPRVVTAAVLAGAASAQVVTVTTTADVIDINATTGTVSDLPGPDGLVSFSEAMIATNNTPGHQTVGFAIPATQLGWCCPQYDGIAVFHSVVGFYWRANDEVTIDGTTQTAFAGDTNPNGAEVLLYGKTFYLNAGNSTLRGFHGTTVQSGGAGSLIEDNTGALNLTLFGGGGSLVRDNDCGTIKLDRSDGNVVVGNTMNRVRVLGGGSGQPAANNRIGGPTLAERNHLTGYGSYNSEGLPSGAAVQLAWADGTLIENNTIGTTPDGLAQGNSACTMGIVFQSENRDVTVRDNLIAGILGKGQGPHHAGQLFGWAIYFWGSTSNVLIERNTIGLDALGNPTLGSVWGVNVDNFSGYTVSGVSLIDNVIAGHIFNGVRVGPTATMRLSGNRIHSNGWLGIDLIPTSFQSGVSPNDPLDTDLGGNGVQNYPVLSAARDEGGALRVIGTLGSSALDSFTLEFFASSACDPSGFGQGEVFLGATSVATDAAGAAAFDVLLPAAVPLGWVVTATATLEPLGATSEFSACVPVTDGSVGTAYCAGDGSSGVCPCSNASAAGSGEGCVHSGGVGAILAGAGSASVAADDLVLRLRQGPAGKVALFVQGATTQAVPFLDGLLCVGAPIKRLEALTLDHLGNGATTTSIVTKGAVVPGATRTYQAWFRDGQGPCQRGANLSAALRVDWL
jgi:hypothetical protein